MKKFFFLSAIICFATGAFSQARQATADYNKTMQPAVETEIPFSEKTVMKSLVEKMEKKGYKGKDVKGYTVFRGVNMAEIGPDTYDLYFKTDRKKKEKDVTILTMLVSTGSDKFISESDNSTVLDNAKSFLNNHTESATAYDLELQVKDQDEATAKAEKKYKNLVEDGQDLVKKKERIEKDIEDNIKKQEAQKAEVEKQTQIFTTLKAKRKQ
jgi:NADH dehydrogenase/NADH:ubiquinone oxidoreductase subunit G